MWPPTYKANPEDLRNPNIYKPDALRKMKRRRTGNAKDLRRLWPPTHKANAEDAGPQTYLQAYGHQQMTRNHNQKNNRFKT